jgi:PAS domain S-box-containing protein
MQEVLGLVGEQESLESRLPEGTASREYMREWGDKGQPLPARILFADDNADMRAYVSRLLSGQYRVETVCDGQAALASAQSSRPALILADVMMPGLDGFQLLAALRADPQTRGIPVILLSARAGEEAKVEGLQAGADDYLTKPFSARELLARIEARLEIEHLRQATERAVREEREQLYALFEQAPSAIAVLQGDELRYELANPRYQQVFGRSADQLLGQTIYSVFPELEGQGVFGLLEDVLRTGVPYLANELPVTFCRETRREPETGYFAFVVQPLYGRTRQIERIMLYAVEVTEQVKARQQLEALSRQKDEFLGIASHELKTPVTSLKGYTQLLQREMRRAGDERVTMLLAKMDAQVNKLTNLITDLLDVTKMESGHLLFQQTSFEWNALIYEIIEEVQRTTARQTILPKLAPSVTLVADRDRLGQVLTNLLTNAIKYAPDTSTILVTTTVTETEVLTSVQDFGIGIPREKQDLIFERFFRVEGERQSTYPGLGLGLYISAEFIKRHHGRIWVESDEGQGTTITFALPLSNPASTQDLAQAY